MISSVNSVSFKAATPYDSISRPGKYTTMPKEKVKKEGNHKFLKCVAGLATAAVAVGALLIAGHKNNWFKTLSKEAFEQANFADKFWHYMNEAGKTLNTKCWEPLKEFPAKISKWWAEKGAKPDVAPAAEAKTV